jgi:hypothetical protein
LYLKQLFFKSKKIKIMSKSIIAIVIAPSIATWDRFTAIAEVIKAVSAADGTALIIANQNTEDSIREIIRLADGVVLICPEDCRGGHTPTAPDDAYARAFGRQAIEAGINAIKIIGDPAFFGSEEEWQGWAFTLRADIHALSITDIERIKETFAEIIPCAQRTSAFRRLARPEHRYTGELNSPVTHS